MYLSFLPTNISSRILSLWKINLRMHSQTVSQMWERLSQISGDSLLLKCSNCFLPVGVCDGESGDVASADVIRFPFEVWIINTFCKGIVVERCWSKRCKTLVNFDYFYSWVIWKINSLWINIYCARLCSELRVCFWLFRQKSLFVYKHQDFRRDATSFPPRPAYSNMKRAIPKVSDGLVLLGALLTPLPPTTPSRAI